MRWLVIFWTLLLGSQGHAQPEIQVLNYSPSPCQSESHPERFNPRIANETLKDDLLTVTFTIMANCCVNELKSARMENNTLALEVETKQWVVETYTNEEGKEIEVVESCECDCCYEVTLEVSGLNRLPEGYRFNGEPLLRSPHPYQLVEPSYSIREGDTINRTDLYGFRQGRWVIPYEDGKPRKDVIYQQDKIVSGTDYFKYYDSGEKWLEAHHIDGRNYRIVEFNRSGKVIRECITDWPLDPCPEP